jgi:hypothetical protein
VQRGVAREEKRFARQIEVAVERFPSRVGTSDAQRPEGRCRASLNAVSSSEADQRTFEQQRGATVGADINKSQGTNFSLPLRNSQPSTAYATSATRSGKCHWARAKAMPTWERLARPHRRPWSRGSAVAVAFWAHSGLYLQDKSLRVPDERRE